MERLPISSTTIASVGYDEPTMLLEIEFTNGHVYQYFDVPREHFEGLMAASSPGNYLNTIIKPNYRFAHA